MIKLTLRSIEPLHLASSHIVSPMATTLDYIPGTALRGALAQNYLDQPGHSAQDQDFKDWFISDAVRYSPCLPLGSSYGPVPSSAWLPLTAYSCKLHPGFRTQDTKNHGVRDQLLEFLKTAQQPTYLPDDHCHIEQCDSLLMPFSGFYSPGKRRALVVRKRLLTRTAINSGTETSAPRQLYSLEVLEEDQLFGGSIELGTREQEQKFQQTLLADTAPLCLGGARSRGLGLVAINGIGISDPSANLSIDLADRLGKFKHALRENSIDTQGQTWFVLTLLSDCMLRDDYLRFRNKVTAADLAQFVHPDLASCREVAGFCKTRIIDGWNAAQKNPRPTELAISAGSVFVFATDIPDDRLIELLSTVEQFGLGDRTQEGYGRVCVNSDFHLLEGQL